MMAASENVKDQPVTVPELIGFYTEVLNGISASDKTLVRAFRDTSNLTANSGTHTLNGSMRGTPSFRTLSSLLWNGTSSRWITGISKGDCSGSFADSAMGKARLAAAALCTGSRRRIIIDTTCRGFERLNNGPCRIGCALFGEFIRQAKSGFRQMRFKDYVNGLLETF